MPSPLPLGRRLSGGLALLVALSLALVGCTKPEQGTARVGLPAADRLVAVVRATAPVADHPALGPLLTTAFDQAQLPLQVQTVATPAEQQAALLAMVGRGARTVLVETSSDDSLSGVLTDLKDGGSTVICLGDRPTTPQACSLIVGWDRYGAGIQQGNLLESSLGTRPEDRRWNVEMLGLDAGDTNAATQHLGLVRRTLPYRSTSPTVIKTGQQSWSQVSVPNGSYARVGKHLATTLEATYPSWPLDALVLPSDDLMPTVLATLAEHHKSVGVLIGSGATREGITQLKAGTLTATLYFDPQQLAVATAATVLALSQDQPLTTNPRRTADNQAGSVPAVWLLPSTVTPTSGVKALASAPALAALLAG